MQLKPFDVLVYLLETLVSLRLQDILVHLLSLQVSGLEVVQKLVVLMTDAHRDRRGRVVFTDVLRRTAHIN